MKVHVYGNTLNNAYNMTQFLRAKGVNAEMFLDDSLSTQQDYPWWEDPALSPTNLPPWIHYHRTKPFFLLPSSSARKMIADFANCDIALVSGLGPVLAAKAGVPFVFYAIGSDLSCIDARRETITALRLPIPLRSKLARTVSTFTQYRMQRAALQNAADRILVLMGYQVRPFIDKFGLTEKTSKCRLAWDTRKYSAAPDEALMKRYGDIDLLFFMVSRHEWTSVWSDAKGNDKFLRAFARFVKAKRPNTRLILVAKGNDVPSSRKLVAELEIESYVEWVPVMNKDGIRALESLPNCVVVDQFYHDEWYRKFPEDSDRPIMGFGSGSIEALCAGRLLITVFTDEAFYEGESPPILSAFSEDEILARLEQVHAMTAVERRRMGESGRVFIEKWHDWRNVTPYYIEALKTVFAARGPRS